MKSLVLPLLASVAIITSSHAADEISDEVPLAATYDWSGAYVGAFISGVFGDISHRINAPGLGGNVSGSVDESAVLGGIQVGYDWQFDRIVVGVVADIGVTGYKGFVSSAQFGGGPPGTGLGTKFEYIGTVRGRIGYAFDRWLAYAHGGLAYGKAKYRAVGLVGLPLGPVFPPVGTFSKTRVGYTVGAGAEYAVTEKISVEGEYAYTDLGTDTYFVIPAVFGGGGPVSATDRFHNFKFGINYRF